jgi:hypothetical protein
MWNRSELHTLAFIILILLMQSFMTCGFGTKVRLVHRLCRVKFNHRLSICVTTKSFTALEFWSVIPHNLLYQSYDKIFGTCSLHQSSLKRLLQYSGWYQFTFILWCFMYITRLPLLQDQRSTRNKALNSRPRVWQCTALPGVPHTHWSRGTANILPAGTFNISQIQNTNFLIWHNIDVGSVVECCEPAHHFKLFSESRVLWNSRKL